MDSQILENAFSKIRQVAQQFIQPAQQAVQTVGNFTQAASNPLGYALQQGATQALNHVQLPQMSIPSSQITSYLTRPVSPVTQGPGLLQQGYDFLNTPIHAPGIGTPLQMSQPILPQLSQRLDQNPLFNPPGKPTVSQFFNPSQFSFKNMGNTLGQVGNNVLHLGGYGDFSPPTSFNQGIQRANEFFGYKYDNNGNMLPGVDQEKIMAIAGGIGGGDSQVGKGVQIDKVTQQAAKDKLRGLMQYADDLLSRGYSKDQVDRISFPEYQKIVQENIPPFLHESAYSPKIPSINVDRATQQRAETLGAVSDGKVANLDDTTRKAFEDWVNYRRASKVEGLVKQKEFQGLDSKGLDGIFEFQSGNKSGAYGAVKNFFDNKYSELQRAGVEFNFKQDYLPQLWQNTAQQIDAVFGKRLGLKPGFTIDSVIKNYEEGIAAGLTPRFKNISQLVGNYEQRANKSVADLHFFTHLKDEGFIQPSGKAPYGWVTLDPDRFPKVKVAFENKQYSGTFSAPPELAGLINNYLKEPSGLLNNIANVVSAAKNRALSFGIPGTAINAHGANILARHTLFGTGSNPISRLMTGGKYILNQGAAQAELDRVLSTAPEAVKNGLTLSTEVANGLVDETLRGKFGSAWNTAFEKPLFDKMIPALKLSSYNELVKNGRMDPHDAAKMVNNIFGGINWEAMGRNRDFQNLLRTFVLAPDWAESTLRLGGNLAKSFVQGGPVAARYRTMATTLLGSIVALNITNKLTSGHYAYENDPGHSFELQIGFTSDGQARYLRPYGTAADMVRLPVDIIVSLLKGDPSPIFRTIQNRLSIPAGAALGLLTNTDYRGQPIYGKTKYGQPMSAIQSAGGVGGQAIQGLGFPSFLKQGVDTATGKQGIEQGLTQGFELPVRYSGGAYSQAQKQAAGISGYHGQQLYDLNKQTQGQTKLSSNQEGKVTQDFSNLQKIYQQRQDDALDTKAKEELKNSSSPFLKKNGKVYLVEPSGDIKTIDLQKQIPQPTLTNSPLVNQRMLQDYSTALTTRLTDIYNLAQVKAIDGQNAFEVSQRLIDESNRVKQQLSPLKYVRPQTLEDFITTRKKSEVSSQASSTYNQLKDGKISVDEASAKLAQFDAVSRGFAKPRKFKTKKVKKIKLAKGKKLKIKLVNLATAPRGAQNAFKVKNLLV